MSYRLQYIGETQTVQAATLDPKNIDDWVDILLEKDKQYIVELLTDGQIMIINGQAMFPQEGTIWIIFSSLGGRIPYSPEAMLHQWRMV